MTTLYRCRKPLSPLRDILRIAAGASLGLLVVVGLIGGILVGVVADATGHKWRQRDRRYPDAAGIVASDSPILVTPQTH